MFSIITPLLENYCGVQSRFAIYIVCTCAVQLAIVALKVGPVLEMNWSLLCSV